MKPVQQLLFEILAKAFFLLQRGIKDVFVGDGTSPALSAWGATASAKAIYDSGRTLYGSVLAMDFGDKLKAKSWREAVQMLTTMGPVLGEALKAQVTLLADALKAQVTEA